MKFFNVYFNASANGIEIKPFDYSYTHWVTNQGDDIIVKMVRQENYKAEAKGLRKITIVKHTLPCTNSTKLLQEFDDRTVSVQKEKFTDDRSDPENIIRNIPLGVTEINPIMRNGMKLNRARVIANFFVPNEENLPFVAVIDGNVNNLRAENLYWSDRNMYPVLNIAYEVDQLNHDVVIHTPAVRALKENLLLYGWEKSYTKFSVPIPNDLVTFFQRWKISMQSAVFSSLRFISQWSFCVYAIEYNDGQEVFVGYTPALDGLYVDQVYKVATEVPWLSDVMFREGHGALKLKYLTLSQSRVEAHDSCVRFMNDYHNKKWKVMNNDFYHPEMERQVSISMKNSELDELNKKLLDEKGVDLETYLRAVVRKLKK